MINFDELIDRNTPEDLKHARIKGIDDLEGRAVHKNEYRLPEKRCK